MPTRSPLQAAHALAATQLGLVTRAQLLNAGVGRGAIRRLLGSGHLRALHRGIYLVGPVAGTGARELAAALACGEGALVSQASAAGLWRLLPAPPAEAPVDILLRCGDRRRPGIRIHRPRLVVPSEATRLGPIPLTTPARTVFDLAAAAPRATAERAFREAIVLRLTTAEEVRQVLAAHPGARGAVRLGRLLGDDEPMMTRSAAERRFLALVRRADLPSPEVNVGLHGLEVDFYWRAEGLVAELDGFAAHGTPMAFENDRRRDAILAAARLRVMRVTWRQLVRQPEIVVARLAQALAAGDGAVRREPPTAGGGEARGVAGAGAA